MKRLRDGLAAALAGIIAILAWSITPAQALGPFCGKNAPSWLPGRYTMSGVMEVGSQLELRRDGSFEFYLAYGANDQRGRGCWTVTKKIVALFPANSTKISGTHTPDTRGFTGMILSIEGRDLVWQIPGSHYRGRYSK